MSVHFTKEHEWVRPDGDVAVCGISDHAQKALGDIVYVELPAIGRKCKQGEQLAVVESAKAASEVYAPLSGEIVAVNEQLQTEPGLINADALNKGWFFKIMPLNFEELNFLMDENAYADLIKE